MSATPVPPEQRSPNRLYVGVEYHERAVADAERCERARLIAKIREWRDSQPDDLAAYEVVNDLLDHLKGTR